MAKYIPWDTQTSRDDRGVAFVRNNSVPVDDTEVWKSGTAAYNYAKGSVSNKFPFVGQAISIAYNDVTTHRAIICDAAGHLDTVVTVNTAWEEWPTSAS